MTIGERVLNLLYPPRCAGCGHAGTWYCERCLGQTPPVTAPFCPRCGQTVDQERCRSCAVAAPVATAIRAAAPFAGPLRQAIHRLKYGNLTAAAPALARLMATAYRDAGWQADLIVPVPLHRTRQRQRGYNQAERLAVALAREIDCPCVSRALVRSRRTADQIELGVGGRRANVQGAFAVRQPDAVAGKTVLLVDDVATTGCTLDECASILWNGGASRVLGLVLARRSLDDERVTTWKEPS